MTFYGALRVLGYLARDVWGAALNAAQPRSRTGYVDHLAELLAGREADVEVSEPIFGSLRDIPRAEPRPVRTAVPIRDYGADDEAQADCGLGGVYVAPELNLGIRDEFLDITYADGREQLMSFVDNDGVLRTEQITDGELQDVMFNRKPVTKPSPLERSTDLVGETLAFVDRMTSAAPAPDTDAAAEDGPAPEPPSGAGPTSLTSGDLRAAAVAALEMANACKSVDAPGWESLSHRLIQASNAMISAAMNRTNPKNVEVDGHDR